MKWSSIVLGALSLAILEGVVSRQQAANNVGGFLGSLGGIVEKFISPAVPAFTTKPTTNTSSSATTTATAPRSTPATPPTTGINPGGLGLPAGTPVTIV